MTPGRGRAAAGVVLLVVLLAVFPVFPGGLRLAVLAGTVAVTLWGAARSVGPTARLGVFASVLLAASLLGSPYAQLSFAAAIAAHLFVAHRVAGARDGPVWFRQGRLDRRSWLAVASITVSAGVALLAWYRWTAPDVTDLVARFLPPWPAPLLLAGGLAFALLNAALEEGAYRGIVQHELLIAGMRRGWAVALQAVAFGAIHLEGFPRGWAGVGLASGYGVLLGLLRLRSGGLLAPWLAHVLTDLVIVGILLTVN